MTVPSRMDNLLIRTLDSLKKGGFESPRLFVDGALDCTPEQFQSYATRFKELDGVVFRGNPLKTCGNWWLSMWELYIRNPLADRYVLFQDDLVTYIGLREYLEYSTYEPKTYWNLYTFPHNTLLAPTTGWHDSDQFGKGTVALVFDNVSLKELLSAKYMVERFSSINLMTGKIVTDSIDGGIVSAMCRGEGAFESLGYRERIHNPSLVQHTGLESSMGNNKHPLADTFCGEEWDVRELIPPPTSP